MTFGILDVELRIDRWIRFTASVHFDWVGIPPGTAHCSDSCQWKLPISHPSLRNVLSRLPEFVFEKVAQRPLALCTHDLQYAWQDDKI